MTKPKISVSEGEGVVTGQLEIAENPKSDNTAVRVGKLDLVEDEVIEGPMIKLDNCIKEGKSFSKEIADKVKEEFVEIMLDESKPLDERKKAEDKVDKIIEKALEDNR
jgi:hypothetical protein